MNLNEVKKHVIFQSIIYVLIGLCFLLSLFAILITPTHASELKTSNITGTIKNTTNCGTADWNHYCYGWGYYSTTWDKAQFSSSLGFGIEALAFDLSGITAYSSSPSTIEIYNAANTFTNTNYSCFFGGSNQPVNCSVSRVNNGRINVNFTTSVGGNPQYLYISIGDNPDGSFQGLNGININKVMLLQTIDDPNENVIENANKNTDDIINNSNENTQSIIDSINQGLFKDCTNLFNYNSYVSISSDLQFTPEVNGIKLISTNTWQNVIYRIPVQNGKNYYFKGRYQSIHLNQVRIALSYNGPNSSDVFGGDIWFSGDTSVEGSWATSFTSNRDGYVYVGIWASLGNQGFANNNVSVFQMMFDTENNPFCPFGQGTNYLESIEGAIQGGLEDNRRELEDIKDIQQDQYDFLTDNSDPTISTNEINNVLGLVSVNDPLSYLLTLPLTLINKINVALNSSCTDYTIGAFGNIGNTNLSNYTFKFSCLDPSRYLGSSLWTTIDIIMAIGLLVISISKFYHAIMNILTLGAEDKAEKQFKYWSPMEFLCVCLGGGFYDAAWSHNQGGDN